MHGFRRDRGAKGGRPRLDLARLGVGLLAIASVAGGSAPRLVGQDVDPRPRVLPADEGPRDSGFFAFRARLQRAIAERDTATVLAAVDPEIKLSFGGDFGIESFRGRWLHEEEGSEWPGDLWSELGAVLALGGRFEGDRAFIAPYTFTDAPSAEVDPFDALIAVEESVPVRAAPAPEAETLLVLSFEVVLRERRPPTTARAGWTAVRLPGGTTGYVRSRSVRSPIDYRAFFVRRDGRWRMTIFIAGD